jgi:membrane protease YdiL (CAAX protease family)
LTNTAAPRQTALSRILAWLVILAAAAFCAYRAATTADPQTVAHAIERRARAIVGAREVYGASVAVRMRPEVDSLDTGSPETRQRAVILVAEMLGAADAHRRLAEFDAAARAEGGDVADRQRILDGLYPAADPESAAARVDRLDSADRERIAALGWLGRLALEPAGMADPAPRQALLDDARRGTRRWSAVGLALLAALLVGCAACVAFVVLFATRKLTLLYDAPAFAAGLGVETFAVWMTLHLALGAVLHEAFPPERGWIGIGLAELVAPAALLWPIVRGAAWSDVRRAYGLHCGAGVVKEIGCGVAAWFASLPFVGAGLFASYLLIRAAGNGSMPPGLGAHPASYWASSAGAGDFVLLLLVACVAAPVIEETMFRGALYGHLRAATSAGPRFVSVVLSASAVSLLFASIHPQGWVGVPVLGAMAMSMALTREWRGSLIAPIVMHGLINTVGMVVSRVAGG